MTAADDDHDVLASDLPRRCRQPCRSSSWRGVAAVISSSITRPYFSSATLCATQLPYVRIAMKVRITTAYARMKAPPKSSSSRASSGSMGTAVMAAGAKISEACVGRHALATQPVGDGDLLGCGTDILSGRVRRAGTAEELERELSILAARDRQQGVESPSRTAWAAASGSSSRTTWGSVAAPRCRAAPGRPGRRPPGRPAGPQLDRR